MGKRINELYERFTKMDGPEGKQWRVASGYLGTTGVHVFRDDDDLQKIETAVWVKAGRRSNIYIELKFTEDDVSINRLFGKKGLTYTDVIRVAEKYAEVVREFDKIQT